MFESAKLPHSLDENTFEEWLEAGRSNKMSYLYLLIVWDAQDEKFIPIYTSNREESLASEQT